MHKPLTVGQLILKATRGLLGKGIHFTYVATCGHKIMSDTELQVSKADARMGEGFAAWITLCQEAEGLMGCYWRGLVDILVELPDGLTIHRPEVTLNRGEQ